MIPIRQDRPMPQTTTGTRARALLFWNTDGLPGSMDQSQNDPQDLKRP